MEGITARSFGAMKQVKSTGKTRSTCEIATSAALGAAETAKSLVVAKLGTRKKDAGTTARCTSRCPRLMPRGVAVVVAERKRRVYVTPFRTRRVRRPQNRKSFRTHADQLRSSSAFAAAVDSASFERSISLAVETLSRTILLLLHLFACSCNQAPPPASPNKPRRSLDHVIGGECLHQGLE